MISIVDSKEPENTVIEIVNDNELSLEDEQERLRLERQVERAFYAAGRALGELRDRKLYRSTHKTFKEYCQDRFGFTRSHPYRLIDAASVIDNLSQMSPNGRQNNSPSDNVGDIIPTSERQCRPLAKLEPQQQKEIWRQAIKTAKGRVPSGKVVSDLVAKIERKLKSEKNKLVLVIKTRTTKKFKKE